MTKRIDEKITQYLVLKPVFLEVGGLVSRDIHDKGSIYLSYTKKSDAEEASQSGKYPIYELKQKEKEV
jgi:hypothetical protein